MRAVVLQGDGLSVLIEPVGTGIRVEALGPRGLTAWVLDRREAAALTRLLRAVDQWPG